MNKDANGVHFAPSFDHRRVRRLILSPLEVLRMMNQLCNPKGIMQYTHFVSDKLPEGFAVLSTIQLEDPWRFCFLIQHPSFDPVPMTPGCPSNIPYIDFGLREVILPYTPPAEVWPPDWIKRDEAELKRGTPQHDAQLDKAIDVILGSASPGVTLTKADADRFETVMDQVKRP